MQVDRLGERAGEQPASPNTPTRATDESGSAAELACCFVGLQVCYVTWGYLQEKVMTVEYRTGRFPSATFCVFSNRILAITMAAAAMLHKHRRIRTMAPLMVFAPCSLSNSLSSYAQYQSLRYVSFPLQTLSKSTKVIPVMLIGKLLNKRSYSVAEYLEAMAISLGVSMFSFCERAGVHRSSVETHLLGGLTLAVYLLSDSFTSQWQSRVYKEHPQVDQFQMMFATNMWSIIFTCVALVVSGELPLTARFLVENPAALVDNLAIAVTSAIGQLFIFYTIRRFGPVVFTLIMTTRQVVSVVLSAAMFGHSLGAPAYCGAGLVFATLLLQGRRRPAKK